MATTDSRTGFRLPWSTDRAASREASADADPPADETPAAQLDADARPAPGAATPDDPDAIREQEDSVSIVAPDAAQHPAPAGSPAESLPAAAQRPGTWPAPTGGGRRPTKFLADLTRAMQAAAEQARASTLDQFRADGTSVIEQIHARSATGATELRRRADDDVASIKEWSKAEIARIREETEHRVGARREQLEGQLERHAALIEHEIEKVRGRIAAFEGEMGRFFDDLLREDDPALFAARAASLPEPPSFEDPDDDAQGSLLREPGIGVPEPVVATPADGPAPEAPAAEPVSMATAAAFDREAAMAAIQAAAEEAASSEDEAAATTAEADAPPAAEAAEASSEAAEPPAESGTAEAVSEAVAEPPSEAGVDPRVAILGLTPDFSAAEAEAAEAAAELDAVPEIGGEALAARLSGLVPGEAPAPDAATVPTQVVVTGLVSVASIASFKRHLGRLAGVAHVGVSSGPDGEFVFAVAHGPETSLRELIPTLPGFAARVVGSGEDILQVSAQDPQD